MRTSRWLTAVLAIAGGLAVGGPVAIAAPQNDAEVLQNAFANVAQKAFPAVVVITNKQVAQQMPMYPQLPPEFRFFFPGPFNRPVPPGRGRPGERFHRRAPQVPQPVGKGSGVIIDPRGYVLTNFHVIKDADALEVRLHDGQVFDSARDKKAVVVVGRDEETDLAILRIGNGKVKDLPVLPLADSEKVRVGDWAIAVGAPFNLDYSVSVGVVSQKGRYDLSMNTYENYIQTDASINPGNSGGPLLSIRGEIIGINDFIVTGGGSRGSIGLGFAISSNLARQVADDLIKKGRVVRPWLGIAMQTLTPELEKQFGVKKGVLVSEVMKGDPADKAGIEPGDVILQVGKRPVRTPHDVQFAVLAYNPGDKIKLLIDRRGKRMVKQVTAREKSGKGGGTSIRSRDDLLNQLGLALDESDEGVVVAGVVQGSPADVAQIRRGDIILEVNRHAVKTAEDVVAAISAAKSDTAVFYINRRGDKYFVAVPLGDIGK
ncbi:MAG: PDZ domain-containing protein [Kiritimatiellaeota bacterium]|nr:PDZ domain-containing protein [Kiritimatiellota bacterium]